MSTPLASISPWRKLIWLLRREFWENRGGFFWAPVITGIIVCSLSALGALAGSLHARRFEHNIDVNISKDGSNAMQELALIGDGTLLTGVSTIGVVLGFVVFFYCLGALYDDRRDRSILFWKSLPISDGLTVLSKLIWALILAPVLAIAIGLLVGFCLMLISVLTMSLNGVEGAWGMIWHSHPLRMAWSSLTVVPIYAAWALPAVGWLFLCSAFARSKPFLWAVLVPLLGAILLSWMAILPGVSMPHGRIWYMLVYRGLLSLAPGSWYVDSALVGRLAASSANVESPSDVMQLIDLGHGWHIFSGSDVWLGMALGIVMIALAWWQRGRRDDS